MAYSVLMYNCRQWSSSAGTLHVLDKPRGAPAAADHVREPLAAPGGQIACEQLNTRQTGRMFAPTATIIASAIADNSTLPSRTRILVVYRYQLTTLPR